MGVDKLDRGGWRGMDGGGWDGKGWVRMGEEGWVELGLGWDWLGCERGLSVTCNIRLYFYFGLGFNVESGIGFWILMLYDTVCFTTGFSLCAEQSGITLALVIKIEISHDFS